MERKEKRCPDCKLAKMGMQEKVEGIASHGSDFVGIERIDPRSWESWF